MVMKVYTHVVKTTPNVVENVRLESCTATHVLTSPEVNLTSRSRVAAPRRCES